MLNPDYEHRLYDDHDCEHWVRQHQPHLLPAFVSLPLAVQRADFFRYLVVYTEGGIYADIDTVCQQPAHTWAARDLNNGKAKEPWLLVGLESDLDHEEGVEEGVEEGGALHKAANLLLLDFDAIAAGGAGSAGGAGGAGFSTAATNDTEAARFLLSARRSVANYIFAATVGHPALLMAIRIIVERHQQQQQQQQGGDRRYNGHEQDGSGSLRVSRWSESFFEVLHGTGPGLWTLCVQWCLDQWRQKQLQKQPQKQPHQRVGLVQVLGIEAFGSGLPHSGAPGRDKHQNKHHGTRAIDANRVLVYHDFQASWLLVDADGTTDSAEAASRRGRDEKVARANTTNARALRCDAVGCASDAERALAHSHSTAQREGLILAFRRVAADIDRHSQ
jgi:hypothetical protein